MKKKEKSKRRNLVPRCVCRRKCPSHLESYKIKQMNVQQIEISTIYRNEMSFDRLIVSEEIFRNFTSALQQDATVTIASIKFETDLKIHNTEVTKC